MLAKFTGELKKLINTKDGLIENFRTVRENYHLDDLLNEIELEFDLESFEVLDNGVLTLSRVENCDGDIASYKERENEPTSGLYDVHYDLIVVDGFGDRVSYEQLKNLRHEV